MDEGSTLPGCITGGDSASGGSCTPLSGLSTAEGLLTPGLSQKTHQTRMHPERKPTSQSGSERDRQPAKETVK